MARAQAAVRELRVLARELEEALAAGTDQAIVWLDSPRGRRYRAYAARALMLASPVILRHPFFKTPVGKLVQLAGGATLLAKAADLIRDWEPAPARAEH